jgi:bacteriorhodopsin
MKFNLHLFWRIPYFLVFGLIKNNGQTNFYLFFDLTRKITFTLGTTIYTLIRAKKKKTNKKKRENYILNPIV